MSKPSDPAASFILHELDESLTAQLCRAVSEPGHAFYSTASTSECLSVAERMRAGVVFCNSDRGKYRDLLDALRSRGLQLPVVVVSRIPETSEWLDALDAGAADYCGAPFERGQISWLVQSALLAPRNMPEPAPKTGR
jgi:DNA-binding NtrC family response regulator